jgi:hypothetical protein
LTKGDDPMIGYAYVLITVTGVFMDQQQVRQLADRFIAELRRVEDGDAAGIDSLAEMFADNASLSNSIIEHEGDCRIGRDEVAKFWREYTAAFGKVHSEFFEITVNDHAAGLFWRSVGADAHGIELEYEGVSLLVFDDNGKIAQFKGFFDTRQLAVRAQASGATSAHLH